MSDEVPTAGPMRGSSSRGAHAGGTASGAAHPPRGTLDGGASSLADVPLDSTSDGGTSPRRGPEGGSGSASGAPASADEALEQFLAARDRGENPDPTTFAEAHPEFAPDLGRALEGLCALERVSAREPADAGVPERIGTFRIVRELGRGGMGVVFEAVEDELRRRVALKVLPPELLPSASARARFRREAELSARLDHPGIATVYGTGVSDDRPWIAMRFVEGRTLAHAIAEARHEGARCVRPGPPLPSSASVRVRAVEVAACIADVARALHFAHERGVVHRDVKPSNIVVRPDGTPILLDFGLAIARELDGETLTRTGDTPGTPHYLPPETVSGERSQPDAQGDVYALGVTLYECLTLRRPYEAPTVAALFHSILSAQASSARARNRDIPPDLAVVVATAIERDRSRRYRDAAAFAEDLEAFVAGRPIAARPLPLHGRVLRWAKREPRQALLAALLVVATVAAATSAGTWWASRDEALAGARAARAQALEDAIGEGFSELSGIGAGGADAAFLRALAIDPGCVEARVGLILLHLDRRDQDGSRRQLAHLPEGVHGRDALESLVESRPLTLPRPDETLEGLSALDLCIRGLCWQYQAKRTPIAEQAPWNAAALASFTEAILRAPIARLLYYEQRAYAAQQAGDERTARSASTALRALWPDSPRALYAAGRALYVVDPAEARACLERTIELDARYADAYTLISMACSNAGDYEAAETWGWRGIAIAPRTATLHYWVGWSLMFRNCQPEAHQAFAYAVSLDPAHPLLWSQVALYELLDGDAPRARESYANSLARNPQDHRVRVFYAAALELAGEPGQAELELGAAVAGLYPADLAYWRAISGALANSGAQACSLGLAEAGLTLDPRDAELARLRDAASEALAARR